MKYVIDACSLINLHNGGALDAALRLTRCSLSAGPIVLRESGVAIATFLTGHDRVSLIDGSDVPAEVYLELLAKHKLGEGETEALALAGQHGLVFCSDDRKAREVGIKLLGADRLIGSLRLIRWCVEEALYECVQAYDSFCAMKSLGGFLPNTAREFFCGSAETC